METRRRTLRVDADGDLVHLNLVGQRSVHLRHGALSSLSLEATNVPSTEQELPVEVALLDRVEVRDVDLALLARR